MGNFRDGMHRQGGGGLSQVREFFGVQDFQDTSTAASPLELTTAGVWYDLPNDGLGPISSQEWAVNGHGPIWDVNTNCFDFSDLAVGDLLRIRVDVDFTTTGVNRDVALRIVFGPAYVFDLQIYHDSYKSAVSGAEGEALPYFPFQIKSLDTLNNPAKLQAMSDKTGTSVIVDGWQIETMVV